MNFVIMVWIKRLHTKTGRLCGLNSRAARSTNPLCTSQEPTVLAVKPAVMTWDLSKSLVPRNRMPRTKAWTRRASVTPLGNQKKFN